MKTTSYEISKKLEEAGFSRQPFWIWTSEQCCAPYQTNYDGFRSYDLETLLESICFVIQDLEKDKNYWFVMNQQDLCYVSFDGETNIDFYTPRQKNESLADTAGKMWLMLKEKGLIC